MSTYPMPGAYMRPVGAYGYCLRVKQIKPPTRRTPAHWTLIRYGKTSGPTHQPVKDGHQSECYMTDLQPTSIPGVWADRHRPWSCIPLYWREMRPQQEERGQLEMLA